MRNLISRYIFSLVFIIVHVKSIIVCSYHQLLSGLPFLDISATFSLYAYFTAIFFCLDQRAISPTMHFSIMCVLLCLPYIAYPTIALSIFIAVDLIYLIVIVSSVVASPPYVVTGLEDSRFGYLCWQSILMSFMRLVSLTPFGRRFQIV